MDVVGGATGGGGKGKDESSLSFPQSKVEWGSTALRALVVAALFGLAVCADVCMC